MNAKGWVVVAGACIAVAALAAMWMLWDGRSGDIVGAASVETGAPVPEARLGQAEVSTVEDGQSLPPSRIEITPPPADAPEPKSDVVAQAAVEQPDLAARDWLEIQVLDPEGRPVLDADLSISGVRKDGDRGSWYSMRDGPAVARTNFQGQARISYTRWVDIDGRAIEVDLEVTHPEFVPFRDDSFPIGPGQHPVVLQRGSTVVVSGWYGSPDLLLPNIRIQMDSEAQLPSDAWKLERDGRLSTTQLSPGQHLIWAIHQSSEHGRLASAIESFELAENEWKELHIELHALQTLRGRLEEVVPRPVLDGHVMIDLHHALESSAPSINQTFEAPVHEDGTFEVPELPPGRGQIIALCRGWVSRRTRVDSLAEVGMYYRGRDLSPSEIEEALQRAGDRAYQAQRISVNSSAPIVVLMEPTGILEVTVSRQDGSPVAGAMVSISPNVYWTGVGSTIFPWGRWAAETDASGRARIEDVPPNDSLWVHASHRSFRMSKADRDNAPRVPIVSGEAATLELVLEPENEEGK